MLFVVLNRTGVAQLDATFWSFFAAIVSGGAAYRYRFLLFSLRELECEVESKEMQQAASDVYRFSNSKGSWLRLDPRSLRIRSASPGLSTLLRIETTAEVAGQLVHELVGLDAGPVRAYVDEVLQVEYIFDRELSLKDRDGETLDVVACGQVLPESGWIEIAFFATAIDRLRLAKLEQSIFEIERFQKGIHRREMRILELKGEVNSVLSQFGYAPRYQIDDASDESQLEQLANAKSEAGGRFDGE